MLTSNDPVFLGLAGGAASGKTSTADILAPMARYMALNNPDPVIWSHLFFAMPLYGMASIRQKMVGIDAEDRQRFALHDAINDLFKGWITYEETVDLVYELMAIEVPPEGKARTFLQLAGTELCRSLDPECFTKWVQRKAREEHSRMQKDWDEAIEAAVHNGDEFWAKAFKYFGVIVSDVRFKNECEFIKKQSNGILIKFTCRPEVASERIYNRDGVYLTPEQLSHQSEQDLLTVPDDMYDAIIDSSDISIKEQANLVMKVVEEYLA